MKRSSKLFLKDANGQINRKCEETLYGYHITIAHHEYLIITLQKLSISSSLKRIHLLIEISILFKQL